MTTRPPTGVPSPCINICRVHAGTQWCEGCLRTLDEITRWSRLDDAGKAAVCVQLAERRVVWRQLLAGGAPATEGAP
jgi:uncharacterized protein